MPKLAVWCVFLRCRAGDRVVRWERRQEVGSCELGVGSWGREGRVKGWIEDRQDEDGRCASRRVRVCV